MDRRRFCLSSAAAVVANRTRAFASLSPPPDVPAPLITLAEIEKIDHDRILHAADQYLSQPPVTITASSSQRSKGGKHDYFSEGDYWWPDPKNPNGPYIRRDGFSNPQNFNDHREALIRLSLIIRTHPSHPESLLRSRTITPSAFMRRTNSAWAAPIRTSTKFARLGQRTTSAASNATSNSPRAESTSPTYQFRYSVSLSAAGRHASAN